MGLSCDRNSSRDISAAEAGELVKQHYEQIEEAAARDRATREAKEAAQVTKRAARRADRSIIWEK